MYYAGKNGYGIEPLASRVCVARAWRQDLSSGHEGPVTCLIVVQYVT